MSIIPKNIANAKILFIDDEKETVNEFINQLHQEGFTNTFLMSSMKSYHDVLEKNADLIYLDIAGVATDLSPEEEGLSLLRYIKKLSPWTRVVVLSGSTFSVDKAPDLVLADRCLTKASLSLGEIVELTHEELVMVFAPEFRNVRVYSKLKEELKGMQLGRRKRKKIENAIEAACINEGNAEFDWAENANKILDMISRIESLRSLASAIIL